MKHCQRLHKVDFAYQRVWSSFHLLVTTKDQLEFRVEQLLDLIWLFIWELRSIHFFCGITVCVLVGCCLFRFSWIRLASHFWFIYLITSHLILKHILLVINFIFFFILVNHFKVFESLKEHLSTSAELLNILFEEFNQNAHFIHGDTHDTPREFSVFAH